MNERASGCMFNIGILLFLVGMGLQLFRVDGAVWILALGVVLMLIGFLSSKRR